MDEQQMDEQREEQREAEMAAALPPRYCECCRAQINPRRVLALPNTQICVGCAEKHGPEFRIVAADVVTSKEGSLKKNYGGVEVTFRRRRLPRS